MDKTQKEWISNIKKALNEKNAKVLLLSGASAAGKTFMSEQFSKALKKDNLNVYIFSTDNFYKGITRNIIDKAEKNFYNGNLPNKDKIIEIVRKNIIDLEFSFKLNNESVANLKEKLNGVIDENFANYLQIEFDRINFDEPEAVDLRCATEFLNDLVLNPDKELILPEYSFLNGEYSFPEKNKVKGKDYDLFIMEGIFALNDMVINNIKVPVVKSFVECSLNTLLIRKLNRDITKGRSSMTKQMVFLTYLNTIIPAYFNHILPTKKNADITYKNAYTNKEAKNIFFSSQEKYYIDEKYIKNLKDFELLKKSKQVDYFFSFKNDYNIISLREENDELIELNYKSKDSGLINRTSESFKLKGELNKELQDAKEFTKLFINAGFDFTTTVRKVRSLYCFSDVFFRFDEVKNLGNFIEFVGGNTSQIESVKRQLHLTKKCLKSYYNLMNESTNTEKQIKLKIDLIPENISPKEISQYFVDVANDHCNFMVKSILGPINDVTEAKIRIEDDKYLLSAKFGGNLSRQKTEKPIDKSIAQMLINEFSTSFIIKDSYKIFEDDNHKIDVDKYKYIQENGKPLIIATMYFENESKKNAIKFLTNILKVKKYEDITEDLTYKNKNLSLINTINSEK